MLLGLSGRDIQLRPLQAAQASIERVRHLLWHGRPAQADQELVRFANHSDDIARRNTDPEQVVTRDLLRHCSELRSYVQNNRRAIVSYHRRYHSDRPISTSRGEGCVGEIAKIAWAGASECDGRRGVLIASLSSEQPFLMAGSERVRAARRHPDRPGFLHSRN